MRIVAEDLTFVYNKKTEFAVKALDGVSLAVEDGDFYGLIGHTGSGKSTFVQHINGLIPVQSGSLTVGDFDLSKGKKTKKTDLKALRSKVGMVFQYPEYQLFDETVYKDVSFGYRNFFPQADEKEIKEAVYDALSLVGLPKDVAEKSPFDLSGGQKRRVAIAGVIVTRPEVLILDEPVAGLDPAGKRDLMKLLHTLHGRECKTIIIVSHDMDDVAENCNKAAVFSEGKAVLCGSVKEVFSEAERLIDLRLDVPTTKKIADKLAANGVAVDTDYTSDDFVSKIFKIYKNEH